MLCNFLCIVAVAGVLSASSLGGPHAAAHPEGEDTALELREHARIESANTAIGGWPLTAAMWILAGGTLLTAIWSAAPGSWVAGMVSLVRGPRAINLYLSASYGGGRAAVLRALDASEAIFLTTEPLAHGRELRLTVGGAVPLVGHPEVLYGTVRRSRRLCPGWFETRIRLGASPPESGRAAAELLGVLATASPAG